MVVLVIGAVVSLLSVAGNQVANGAQDLADSVSEGVGQITDWLKDGPLHASDSQINDYLDRAQEAISNFAKDGEIFSKLSEVGAAVGHVLAGFFIVLFSTSFFLADGERIWAWFVRLSPRASRVLVDGSGRVAWVSLTQFVRATVSRVTTAPITRTTMRPAASPRGKPRRCIALTTGSTSAAMNMATTTGSTITIRYPRTRAIR